MLRRFFFSRLPAEALAKEGFFTQQNQGEDGFSFLKAYLYLLQNRYLATSLCSYLMKYFPFEGLS